MAVKKKSYVYRVLIAIDQLANVVLLNGHEDHTISGRVGYKARTTGKRGWLWAEKAINALFFWQPNHCRQSIEWDRVKRERKAT